MRRWRCGSLALFPLLLAAATALGAAPEGEKARFSYTAGYQLGEALIAEGYEGLDGDQVGAGLAAVVAGDELRLDPAAMNAALRSRPAPGSAAEREQAGRDRSYALGAERGQRLVGEGLGDLDAEALRQGVSEALAGSPPALSRGEMMALVAARKRQVEEAHQALAARNEEAGRAFLAANREQEGVKQQRGGLQYRVLAEGHGQRPRKDGTVVVRYRGTHLNVEEFDSSERHGGPATFALGQVVAGWQTALVDMRPGAHWLLFVPPELAYGSGGQPPVIGPNETLIFDLELLEVR